MVTSFSSGVGVGVALLPAWLPARLRARTKRRFGPPNGELGKLFREPFLHQRPRQRLKH